MIIILCILQCYLALRIYKTDEKIFGHSKVFIMGYIFYMLIFPFSYTVGWIENEKYADTDIIYACVVSTIGIITYYFARKIKIKINKGSGLHHYYFNSKLLLVQGVLLIFSANMLMPGYLNYFLGIYIIIAIYINNSPPSKKIITNFTLIVGVVLLALNFTSARRDVVAIILIYLYMHSWILDQAKHKKILFIVIVGTLMISSVYFVTLNRSFNISVDEIGEFSSRAVNHYDGIIGMILSLADFGVAFDNYIAIMKSNTYIYGDSFIRLLSYIIPRSLWPDKPLDVVILITNDLAQFNFAGGTSQSITLIGELYWNFGLISVMLGMGFLGILNNFLDRLVLYGRPQFAILSLSLIPFTFLMWRGGFTTQLVYFMPISFVLLINLYIFDLISKLNNGKN